MAAASGLSTRFEIERAYIDFDKCRGQWDRLLTDDPRQWVLFSPKSPAIDRLRADPDWAIVEKNDDRILLTRGPAGASRPARAPTTYTRSGSTVSPGVLAVRR